MPSITHPTSQPCFTLSVTANRHTRQSREPESYLILIPNSKVAALSCPDLLRIAIRTSTKVDHCPRNRTVKSTLTMPSHFVNAETIQTAKSGPLLAWKSARRQSKEVGRLHHCLGNKEAANAVCACHSVHAFWFSSGGHPLAGIWDY